MGTQERTHICEEHLGAGCHCAICGKVCHDYHSDDDGTFAASGKVVTARCARCGDEEHYYADTGIVIEHYRGRSYEREPQPEAVHGSPKRAHGELLYLVGKLDGEYIITGVTERTVAEKTGLRHLTVIIVPFVTDGENKGCWVVHNRHDKQVAKGKRCAPLSLNLFGGHCGLEDDWIGDWIGKPVGMDMLLENALRELSEELLRKVRANEAAQKKLELWRDGAFSGEWLAAAACAWSPDDLIPAGFTEHTSKDNVEYSYVFALPVSGADAEELIAADNYIKSDPADGAGETDIALPIVFMTEAELKRFYKSNDPNIEVCDAITRLWAQQNSDVYESLLKCMDSHMSL